MLLSNCVSIQPRMFGFGMLAVFVFDLALDLRNGVRVCVTVCRVSAIRLVSQSSAQSPE